MPIVQPNASLVNDRAIYDWIIAAEDRITAVEGGSGGSGSGFTLQTVEVDFGSEPRRSGNFTISGSGLAVGKPVHVTMSAATPTGKGSGEAEFDIVTVSAIVESTSAIRCYWVSTGPVKGNFKFDYQVSG